MEEIAQGRVWTGKDAVSRGLVDAIGGFSRAVAIAKHKANIPHQKKVPNSSNFYFCNNIICNHLYLIYLLVIMSRLLWLSCQKNHFLYHKFCFA